MPISEKIRKKIEMLEDPDDLKKLMITILEEEDKGSHRYTETYERLVTEYLRAKDGDNNDQNN